MRIFLLIVIAIASFLIVKNGNTCINHLIISRAIYQHNVSHITGDPEEYEKNVISYDVAQPCEKTLFRFWDWGYKHILPPDIYEHIKEFIE